MARDHTAAFEIRDAAYWRLKLFPGVRTVERTPVPPLQPAKLPSLGIYLPSEQMTPDGDWNVGVPKFEHDATIAFALTSLAPTGDELEHDLDALKQSLLETLLQDGSFVALFEGIKSISTALSFPRDGETQYAQLVLRMVVGFRSEWKPRTPNDLLEVDVTHAAAAKIPGAATPTLQVELPGA